MEAAASLAASASPGRDLHRRHAVIDEEEAADAANAAGGDATVAAADDDVIAFQREQMRQSAREEAELVRLRGHPAG